MANAQSISKAHETVRILRNDHRQILALFHLYLAAPADSRQATVDHILELIEEHFHREESLLADGSRPRNDQERKLLGQVLMEHEELRAMVDELRRSEADDDQALDEFFEDTMRAARAHFITEERDLFPHLETLAV
ncbi:MAG: hypothetical protein NBKEAIPA_01472 [Nitrospirae bacterium]|nr:MAG: Hemerythrin HHE cation binding domain protein [Nitrospira sp. OLB3]MBV6469574.1 hypothetical protein [Nitrospirota bacterium]MCK6493412.1 hemerythrin domain-containing protein [Nitrospira sp.]MEB2338942.1 hemerythrin domain-containing protein [Nitrospirales bacterium]MCK6499859.1 hemerythrin domain-containing protein [Nitrospira sp.]